MHQKRRLSPPPPSDGDRNNDSLQQPLKRRCLPPPIDILTRLSDEILLRILSHLTEHELLCTISHVSRHLHRLASDSQLWRAHYYTRFVLPRALRIPGFRGATGRNGTHRLRYSAKKAVWADGGWGRRGGLVDVRDSRQDEVVERVDWKRQYKLRHNWTRGKCAVQEVSVRDASSRATGRKTLVKVVKGIAITVDSSSGLRAWDLRTRHPIAQVDLQDKIEHNNREPQHGAQPSCLAIDEQGVSGNNAMDITVGFSDGAFGVWRLDIPKCRLTRRYRHEKSCNGELVAVAYGHPYALTATSGGLISLYTFSRPSPESRDDRLVNVRVEEELGRRNPRDEPNTSAKKGTQITSTDLLPSPYLLTSLKSHTTRLPLALSIRKMASSISASIAYTFDSRDGWCIGVQDINIKSPSRPSGPETLSSRLAYTLPIKSGTSSSPSPQSFSPPSRPESSTSNSAFDSQRHASGPTTLCYSHPYLLATLPDNTLILHLCTSTATSLSISPGMRLWGHTSGISDAEITPRGKAVSVSTRGDEIRVWELEGRVGGSSIEVRPRQQLDDADSGEAATTTTGDSNSGLTPSEWEDRRNWVGFDDEMVIVLKEARDGRESLMVYDFT